MLYVVVPVYREAEHLKLFLTRWLSIECPVRIIVCNASIGDESSAYIESINDSRVVEIGCGEQSFWTESVYRGLACFLDAEDGEFVCVTNVDTLPSMDSLHYLATDFSYRAPCVGVAHSGGEVLSLGVNVRSWLLSLNSHPCRGKRMEECDFEGLAFDFAPTRLLILSKEHLREAGMPDYVRLPHYCADYEFTRRIVLHFGQIKLDRSLQVEVDLENSGLKSGNPDTTLLMRFRQGFSLKCNYCFRYRLMFVILVYPVWSMPIGLITHFMKIAYGIARGVDT